MHVPRVTPIHHPVTTWSLVPAGVIEAACGGWGCETTVEGIYEGLMEVAEASDEALEALGEGARQYVRQHFTWSVVAERYLEMVSTVFNGDHSSTSGA